LATSAAKASDVPGVIVPVVISLPPLTSSNVIGLAIGPSAWGRGASRLSPPGTSGARIEGTMSGRSDEGIAYLTSAAESGLSIQPFIPARSAASTMIVMVTALRKIQRRIASSGLAARKARTRC
jgi:hypothetical protein